VLLESIDWKKNTLELAQAGYTLELAWRPTQVELSKPFFIYIYCSLLGHKAEFKSKKTRAFPNIYSQRRSVNSNTKAKDIPNSNPKNSPLYVYIYIYINYYKGYYRRTLGSITI
jgi:hypothetical protein